MDSTKLPKRLFFLEAARTLAAVYVFIYHVLQRISPVFSILKTAFSFGQEAVMLFFVLSGFVIYYSQRLKGEGIDTKKYLNARFTRIYPVFIFALFISYLSICVIKGNLMFVDLPGLIKNLLMLQDFIVGKPGVWVSAYMGNAPLWSLSYEWWFYILFIPVVLWIKPKFQIHIVSLVSIFSLLLYFFLPNQICLWLIYFIIWWAGVEAAKKYVGDIGKNNFVLLYFLVIISILAIYSFYIYEKEFEFGIFPILFLRHFTMALLFYCFLIKVNVSKFKITEKNILVKLAPYSYAFYVLHYPILNIFHEKGLLNQSNWNIIPLFLLAVCITWFAEDIIHKHVSKWIKSLN